MALFCPPPRLRVAACASAEASATRGWRSKVRGTLGGSKKLCVELKSEYVKDWGYNIQPRYS